MPRTYAIIGTGALGGYYGGLLARSGAEVHFLLHSDYEHVRQHGLRVDSVNGDFHLESLHAYNDAAQMPACDVTIVALKTTNNHLLGRCLPQPTSGGGVVLVLQNGLHVERDAQAIVGPGRVLGACCFLCSNKVGPGHIRHLDYGRIAMGVYHDNNDDNNSNQSHVAPAPAGSVRDAIASDMRAAGIEINVVEDLLKVRWQKLMWNIPFNGLSVVLDASTDKIVGDLAATALARDIINDVRQAAAACGSQIDASYVDKMIDDTRAMVPYDSSMRVDFLKGREMEIEAIVGNPLAELARCGGHAPRLQMLYQQLKFLAASRAPKA